MKETFIPALSIRESAKWWISLLGVMVQVIIVSIPDAPKGFSVAAALCTAVAVFLVPNTPTTGDTK